MHLEKLLKRIFNEIRDQISYILKRRSWGKAIDKSKAKLILVTGMPRSGSTWQYNVIRLALKEGGYKVHILNTSCGTPLTEADYCILSVHKYNFILYKTARYVSKAYKIFTSVREFKGIRKSLERIGSKYKKGGIRHSFKEWVNWAICADYIMSYTDMIGSKLNIVKTIIKELELDVNPQLILKKVEKLRPPKSGKFSEKFDPLTLLHPNHIG